MHAAILKTSALTTNHPCDCHVYFLGQSNRQTMENLKTNIANWKQLWLTNTCIYTNMYPYTITRHSIYALLNCKVFSIIWDTADLPKGVLWLMTVSTNSWRPPASGWRHVPWPIRSGGKHNRSIVSCSAGTCHIQYPSKSKLIHSRLYMFN